MNNDLEELLKVVFEQGKFSNTEYKQGWNDAIEMCLSHIDGRMKTYFGEDGPKQDTPFGYKILRSELQWLIGRAITDKKVE